MRSYFVLMKDTEIKRVNFITKQGVVFDYKHLAMYFIAWLIVLFFITGVQYFRLWWVNHGVKSAKGELAALMQDQERRLAMLELTGPKVDRTKQEDLIAIFRNPPCWSCVMDELQSRVLRPIRITSIKGEDKEGKFLLNIQGEAPSMRLIVEFLQRLQLSPLFKDVVLQAATRDRKTMIFNYTITTKILIFNKGIVR
ncbi:MAG: hypothetical protein COS89_00670 [Deltaproteobacteria bacterium CG07_land_8_20_14_0_80_38_7]|nr:MAG: hypothetical protein COS89_00670 [Deltaproteobacteria bacterium CG07_land_8_20_14_0_80_38_7]